MKNPFTIRKRSILMTRTLLLVGLASFAFSARVYAQTIYATSVVTDGDVTNPVNVIDADPNTYSTLTAYSGLILGLGNSPATIDMEFPTMVPANTTSFVRIETEDNILGGLLGGTIGHLVSDVLGIVLLGNQEFVVEVSDGNAPIMYGYSVDPSSFSGERMKIVVDENNHTYLAITPAMNYKYIKIKTSLGSLIGLGASREMKVWDPFYTLNGLPCDKPRFTSYDATGISLELLQLGGGISDMHYSIDEAMITYSTLSLGVVNVASSLTQRAYFDGPSSPGDLFGVRMSFNSALLALNLASAITVSSSLGATGVTSQSLQSLLTPANIAAIENGLPFDVYLPVGTPIDRVAVKFQALLGVEISQSILIHEFFKVTPAPTLATSSSGQVICEGTSTSLVANASNSAHETIWYSSATATTPLGVINSGAAFNTGVLNTTTTFYVASAIPGCPGESPRIPVVVTVTPAPDLTSLILPSQPAICAIDTITIDVLSHITGTPNWYLTSTSTTPITNGLIDNGHTFGLTNGVLDISGLTTANSPFTVYLGVTDLTTGCTTTAGNYFPFTFVVEDQPTPTTTNANQQFCANTSPDVNDLTAAGANLQWYDAATGGNLLTSTSSLVDGTTYYASSTGAACESSVRLAIAVTIDDVAPPTTSAAHQQFCLTDLPTIGDLSVVGTTINWYDANGNPLTSGLLLADSTTYYATNQGVSCESSDSLAIFVTISNLSAPTTANANQIFCVYDNATIEDLQTNESNVQWSDVNGNVYPAGTALSHGSSYYGNLITATCIGSQSVTINVQLEQPTLPTTLVTDQTFCENELATVATLAGTLPNLVWYDAPTNGNLIPNTTLLVNGTTYYAAQDGIHCESENRIAVTVNVTDVAAPTTTSTTQNFCVGNNVTIADLQVNETNVNWYDANGNLQAPNASISTGTYYATLVANNCESLDSLAVMVTINPQESAQIYGDFQNVCYLDTLMYYAPSGMSQYNWTVNGGVIISGGTTVDNTVSVLWNVPNATSISVQYQNAGGCLMAMEDSILIEMIHCSDLTISKVASNFTPFVGQQIEFTIKVVNNGPDIFSDVVVNELLQSGFVYISYQASHGTYNTTTGDWLIPVLGSYETAELKVVVRVNAAGSYKNFAAIASSGDLDDYTPINNDTEIELVPGCFTVFNEMSPNGDGINDVFFIDCIEYYPNNSVTIFNRYGNEVYQVEGYKNDWNGIGNASGIIGKGEPLPEGTYYYLLKVNEVDVETSGWIYIVR